MHQVSAADGQAIVHLDGHPEVGAGDFGMTGLEVRVCEISARSDAERREGNHRWTGQCQHLVGEIQSLVQLHMTVDDVQTGPDAQP